MKKLAYIFIALLIGFAIQLQARVLSLTDDTIPMSGIYIISATGDYSTISAAVADLILNGVDGSVAFDIATGTYNEQVVIPEIIGASDVNTITFQSPSGDKNVHNTINL